ncbi:hypothetical protein V7S43_003033 [Phytophthora oleae]|uniref:Dynein axonemal assembly factor 5 TPR repeats domain-containing protein n=1 Tax=Phytophthora oleae TaxID=2107226 RepID=A0ABD3G1L3_9STRA
MKHFSVATVRTLMPLLLHRLARVRVAVVETIRALVTCPNAEKCKGSGTEAIVDLIGHRDENVIPVASFYTTEVRLNYFAKLDQDRNPMVRRAFFAMISDWMTNLPDRYDYESRLLPYLLSAVSDEDPTISEDALKTLEILGERYEREHGEEVSNTVWTEKILQTITADVHLLVNTLLRAWGGGHDLLPKLQQCADLTGRLAAPRTYLPLLLSRIRCHSDVVVPLAATSGKNASQTAVALEVLSYLLQGSLDKMVLPHVPEILETVSLPSILDLESKAVKLALGQVLLQVTVLLEQRIGYCRLPTQLATKLALMGPKNAVRTLSFEGSCRASFQEIPQLLVMLHVIAVFPPTCISAAETEEDCAAANEQSTQEQRLHVATVKEMQ